MRNLTALMLLLGTTSLVACDEADADPSKIFQDKQKASAAVELVTMTCWHTGLKLVVDKYEPTLAIVDERNIFKTMARQSFQDMTTSKEQAQHAYDMSNEEISYLVDLGKGIAHKDLKDVLSNEKMDADALTNFGTPIHCAKLLKANI